MMKYEPLPGKELQKFKVPKAAFMQLVGLGVQILGLMFEPWLVDVGFGMVITAVILWFWSEERDTHTS